jgi:hypothetical protein
MWQGATEFISTGCARNTSWFLKFENQLVCYVVLPNQSLSWTMIFGV